jgi:isocitrate dehydrogenase
VVRGIENAIAQRKVTYDFARQLEENIEPVSCSGFGDAVINYM